MTKEEKEELARQKEYEDFRGPIGTPKKGSLREQQNAYDNQMISWYKNDRNNLAYTDDTTPIHVSGEWEDYGESSHDSFNVMNPNEGQGELNEMRASDQGFWEKIGLGAAKMTTTAASTFLDGTVGFLYGVGSAIKNGDASRIWDNDFSNAMQDFNEWCEEKMPHYSSRYEGWGTDFWGNFIGKDILQNLGFQIGTAGALIVPTGIGAGLTKTGLSLTKNLAKFTKLKNAKNLSTAFKDLITNTYSAVGESTIEGLQNKRDFVKYQNQINDDNFIQQNNILDRQWAEFVRNNYNGDERMAVRSQEYLDYVQKKNQLLNDKKNKERFIQQEADKVGDMTFMTNMAIVGLSNYVTFGKAICGGMGLFKRSIPTVTDIVDRKTKEVIKKNVSKNTAKEVINKGKFAVKDKTTGKTVLMDAMTQERGLTKSPLINTIKNAISEGLEEMNQSVASEWFAGAAEEDMLQYDALTRNGMAYDDVVRNINNSWMSWGNMAKAMKKVYTDPAQWRQFFSGMIGVGFSPHFQKGADGKLHFKLNNIGEQNAEINAYNSSNAIIAENINNILNSEESQNYIRGLVRHSALDDAKRSAVALDSKMDFQDADFAQFVSDISMLSDAGKLDLLKAQLENMKTLTDEELEDYCTKLCNDVNGKKVGEFVDSNGNYIGTSDQSRMEIRKKINSRVDQLLYDMETYQRSINEIDDVTGGHLSKQNLATFAWEKANLQNKFNRAKSILGSDSSARNITSVKDKLGLMLKTNTDQLKSVKESLNKEKQRIADANKMSENAGTAKIDKSDFQKKLENDIEIITQKINVATEVSQLIADLEAMQSHTTGSSPMADIKKLFSKYADFRDSMPEVAKMFELNDDESLSLEHLMYSGQLNKFLGLVTNSTINDTELDNDYQDCAKLYKRGLDIEKSLDNILKNPERYESERTEMERKIIARENADTIKTIEDEIKKAIDNGSMNFGNIDERTKEIIDNLKSAKNEKNVGRRLFRNAVNMLRDTPFDSLRKIALENVLNSKKYKYMRDFAKFVNYVNVRIAMSKASPDALMIAQKTFTEFIKDKKTVEECLKAKIKLDDIDVSELYKDNYTPDTYANAQLVQNEVFKMFETIFKDFAMDYYSPKLNIDKYDSGNILSNSEAVKANEDRKQIDKVKNKLTKYVDDFSGDILSTEDQENIFKHIDSVIEEEFAETNYEDPTNLGLDSAKLELKTFMHKYLLDNANKRLTNLYDNKANNIEELKRNKEIIAKAKAKINKTIDSIGKNLKDDNTFNTYFDKLSEQDDSIEVRDSKEGYYVEGGKVMRGYMAPCLVRLPGEESADIRYAIVFNTNSNNRYWVYIIGNDGQRIGSLLVDKSEIDLNNLDFTNVEGVNNLHDRLSLTDFATIKLLEKENQILNDQQYRLQNLREQASAEVLQSNGTIDENGKVDVSQNLHNSTVTVNAIMDGNITKSKSDIETIVESSRPASEQRLTIEYYSVYDYNNDHILRVQLPTNGNRIKIKEENGKSKDVKFSQSLYKKEGINGVIKSIYGDNIDVLTSSEEEWTGKKSEPKTQKKEETKPVEQTKEKETKEIGRSQINKVIRDLKELKSDDYIGKLNAVSFYDATISKLDKNPATKEEQEFIESIREDCKNNGYEIEPLLGKEYNGGMKIVASFIEDENALENSQIITSVKKPQIMKDGVMIQAADVIVSLGPETSEHTTETPVQEQPAKPVETPKQKAKKEAKKKAKNTASELSKQLAKLEQIEKELEEAVKNNPDYADTLHSVRTFKNYVQLVRDNYEEMGRPEKVVIDANAIWSINNKLTGNLKSIFGNDNVLVLSDEEIENSLTGNEQLSASEGNKNLTQQSSDIQFSSTLSETELIKQKAIADGTFMKAPNGNPTNLTEQQWLQVRTKAFKDWFGDWESANNIESNIDKIDTSKVTIENRPWKGNENKRSLWLSLNNQPEKGAFVLVKDDELNQYSIHFKTATETGEHNTKDTVISTKEERKTLFKEFVKLIPDGAIISTWGEISNDGIKGLNNVGRDMTKIGTRTIKHKDGGVDFEIPIYQKVSNVSKVVDENGEPLVVYHTISQDRFEQGLNTFETFDTKSEGRDTMLYFADNYLMSKSYGPVYEVLKDQYESMFNDSINDFKDLSKTSSTIFNKIKLIESMTEDEYRNSKYYVKDSTIDEALKVLKKDYKNVTRRELFAFTSINRWRTILANVNKYANIDKTKYSATRAFFINAKNPIIYDGNYNAWNKIDIGNHDLKGYANKEAYNKARLNKILSLTDSLYEEYKTNHTKEEVDFINNEFEGKLHFQDIAEQIVNKELPELNSQLESTRSLEEKHRYDDYDAVISKNIQDWGRSFREVKKYAETNGLVINKTGNVYAVKTPNQVKSATDNNGEFSKENDNIYLSKQNGEIFGYTADGKIVLNKDRIRLDTPVHEYTHLWDQAVQRINPEFWNQGKELMKQSAEWQKVINDPAYANIKDDEDKVASEVHSRLAGYIAAGKSIELYAKDRTKDKRNWFKRLIDWFMKFKDFTLKNIFNMSSEDCKQVSLEQFLNAPVADFFIKTDPRKIGKEEIVVQNEEQTIDEPINEESTETLNNVEPDHIVETIENKTNELKEQIPQQPLNVSNQEEREVFATIDAINEHNNPPVPLDTYRPAISRFPIGKDNDTRPSYVVLGKGFEYIWNMYNALGAWDYVSQGKLSKDDDIYIGYGKVGENSNTAYYDVVFFVKNGDEYQMIGTLVNKNAPESANKLRNDIKRRYESDKQGMEKITVSAQKASGQFQSGNEFDFYLVKNGDKFLTTKPSKILNGRMQFTDTEYRSLKDVETPDGSKDFNIGFFTPGGLRDNMTTTDKDKAKQFRSASSERSGHCVLIINKPDGDYQLVPLRLAKLYEIINKSNNQVANDFRSIVSDLFDIYKSDKSAVMKNLEIVDSLANGGIITRIRNLVHTNEFSLFYNTNNTITVSVNGKKYKNQRFDSVEKMQDFFEDIMKDCLICVNKNTLNNPEILSKYVESDVFSTNLKTTEFANPFYTLMPIDSNGKELDVVNDIQDDNYLDENDITTVLAKFGDKTYAVVDKFGNVKIGVKQFDEFNTSEANRLYSPKQRMRMISYALLKNGMQSNPNDSLFDDYHIDGDENETTLLAHKTMYGDIIFYEVENFTEISPDRVSYYDGEGNLIKLSKPKEIETVDNDDSDVESYEDDDYYDYLKVDLDDEDDVIEVDDEEYIVLDDEDLNDDEIYNEDDDISEESIEVDNESEDKFQEDVNTLMDNELAKGIWAIYETLKLDGGDQNPFDFTLTLGFSEYKYIKDDIRDIGGDKLADTIENLVERYDFRVVSDYAKLFMNSNTKTLEDGFKLVSEEAVRKVLKNNILNKEDDMSKLANKKNDECQL